MERERNEEREWLWAGNIQECVVRYMKDEEGFTILSSNRPPGTERGYEIVAERNIDGTPAHRLVTVLGWPGPTYKPGASPSSQSQPRPTRPEAAARNWLAQAVLDIALGRGESPDVELSLALPATASYIRYLQRLRWFLVAARISIYLVSQAGSVATSAPGLLPSVGQRQVPGSSGSAVTGTMGTMGTRRKLGLPGSARLELPLLHVLAQSGGELGRSEAVTLVARWFPEVPQAIPAEFGVRVSMAQSYLQQADLSKSIGRGIWKITEEGRARHDAEWQEWENKERKRIHIASGQEPEVKDQG